MVSAKEAAQELLNELPDDVSMDTIIAELDFKARVLRSLQQADQGQVVSAEEARGRMAKWLK